jgi:hypothetical protein
LPDDVRRVLAVALREWLKKKPVVTPDDWRLKLIEQAIGLERDIQTRSILQSIK